MEVGGRGFKGSGGNDSLGGQRVGGRWSEGHGNGREGDENQLQKKKKFANAVREPDTCKLIK